MLLSPEVERMFEEAQLLVANIRVLASGRVFTHGEDRRSGG
jgi:Flp pilus assembly protein CpaB